MSPPEAGRAAIIGTGLIGGSLGLALRARGWHVTGRDHSEDRARRALELGAVDAVGKDPEAAVTFIAVPVGSVVAAAGDALAAGSIVTDVGSVKAPIVAAIDHPKFIGGHPMAGSEALGVEGARGDLFEGATWVLTPTSVTDPRAQAEVHSLVRSLGADVVTLSPDQHDELVATVSHVPHLAAATLMGLAAARAESDSALLRLAAGGFRDMTRIAAGDPSMWLDICADNRDAILDVLDAFIGSLASMREVVGRGDRPELLARLRTAQQARISLPVGAPPPEQLSEVRVGIPDRPGQLAAVTALATELAVNVYDVEVAHSPEERGGRLILVVDASRAEELAGALRSLGRSVSVHELGA
jgi:prephenate dehydrogenase